jgi:hypothetical protein
LGCGCSATGSRLGRPVGNSGESHYGYPANFIESVKFAIHTADH